MDEYAVDIILDPPPDEDCSITRSVLEAVLTQDDAYRRSPRSAPLCSLDRFLDLQSRLASAPLACWALVPTPHFRARRRRVADGRSPEQRARARLAEQFPCLEAALGAGEGRVVATGAAVALAVLEGELRGSACELALVGVEEEEEAGRVVARVVAAVERAAAPGRVRLVRDGRHVQMAVVEGEEREKELETDCEGLYRIRLRLHASLQEVVLEAEMPVFGAVLHRERGFFLSPFAAFSLATRSVVADPSARRSATYEWQIEWLLQRGFCLLLPSLSDEALSEENPDPVFPGDTLSRAVLGGRTRGPLLSLGGASLLWVGREDDRENRRHNFGHAARRLLLARPLPANPSHRALDTPSSLGYLNILNACIALNQTSSSSSPSSCSSSSSSCSSFALSADSFSQLILSPLVLGLDQLDEVFSERDLSLSRARLLFGPDALLFAQAFLADDTALLDSLVASAQLRLRRRLLLAQSLPLCWQRAGPLSPPRPLALMSARLWYPPSLCRPLLTGLPRLFAPVIRQLCAQHAGWASLPLDVLALLIRDHIAPAMAADVIGAWLAKTTTNGMPESISCSESETITSEGD